MQATFLRLSGDLALKLKRAASAGAEVVVELAGKHFKGIFVAFARTSGAVNQIAEQIRGPGRRLAGQIVTQIKRLAGFADEGIPLIIDSNSMRRGFAEQLRSRGFNVRTVDEIFGADPGDFVIKDLAETLGGRVLTNNVRDFGRDVAIRIDPRATRIETWIRLIEEGLGQ
jgi:hypothetical protein